GNSFGGGIQHFLALIISTNSLIEVIATVLITSAVVPSLEKLK
ncbi:MAG: pantothenic acid transporter pant, partial [Streptococcus parasanguinis]|nr:pantothenic acid transporter pant [Streptococcus parasanguinis]